MHKASSQIAVDELRMSSAVSIQVAITYLRCLQILTIHNEQSQSHTA